MKIEEIPEALNLTAEDRNNLAAIGYALYGLSEAAKAAFTLHAITGTYEECPEIFAVSLEEALDLLMEKS